MRNTSILVFAAASFLAVSFAGCSANGSLSTLPSGDGGSVATEAVARSPQLAAMSNPMNPIAQLRLPPRQQGPGPDLLDLQVKELVIGTDYYYYLDVFNGYYSLQQQITNRINYPDGLWFDSKGNLYSSQYYGEAVEEYDPGQQAAAWTYSSGLNGPSDVTTDAHQNVYVTNFSGSTVEEFAHRTNTALYSCSISNPEGITVDSAGDVFVFYSAYPSYIAKYAGGLCGCSHTNLTPTFGFKGGLKMDKTGNLLAFDQANARIDILPAPYTAISKYIPEVCEPYNGTLNPTGNLLFVADPCYGETFVYHYPSGVFYTTLSTPAGAYGVAAR